MSKKQEPVRFDVCVVCEQPMPAGHVGVYRMSPDRKRTYAAHPSCEHAIVEAVREAERLILLDRELGRIAVIRGVAIWLLVAVGMIGSGVLVAYLVSMLFEGVGPW